MSIQTDTRIVIIGAGVGGLAAAIALKRKNINSFEIYEKATDIGGTWRDNTYPGCACDIPTHWYSLSSDPYPDWSWEMSDRNEIMSYWKRLVVKYDLTPHLNFGTAVEKCVWNSDTQSYELSIKSASDSEATKKRANIVISAVGGIVDPQYPDLPGSEGFKGERWHSGRWRHDVNLSGKRVGVIGNGCSAAQFIPIITEDPTTEVINFCRSPQWFVPSPQFKIPGWMRWIFRNIPFAMYIYRCLQYMRADVAYSIFPMRIKWVRAIGEYIGRRYIRQNAPEKYHKQMMPTFPLGCKRTIFDPGYVPALHRPNIDLNWDGVDHFEPSGIVTKKGELIELDVLIFSTGFTIMSHGMEVIGANNLTLIDYWKSVGGPTAYLGTTMPGFPNFYSILGPNTVTGHASVIFTEEAQIQYILQLIEPVLKGSVTSLEVKDSASERYNDTIQARLKKTVYMNCLSWYRGGGGHNEKNIASYPGPHIRFWWNTLVPKWSDYTVKGSGVTQWKPRNTALAMVKALLGY